MSHVLSLFVWTAQAMLININQIFFLLFYFYTYSKGKSLPYKAVGGNSTSLIINFAVSQGDHFFVIKMQISYLVFLMVILDVILCHIGKFYFPFLYLGIIYLMLKFSIINLSGNKIVQFVSSVNCLHFR